MPPGVRRWSGALAHKLAILLAHVARFGEQFRGDQDLAEVEQVARRLAVSTSRSAGSSRRAIARARAATRWE